MENKQETSQNKTTTHLKVGDKAPDFSGVDQNGKEIALKDFKGKKLVLYFYPKDDTAGCTEQAKNIRDNYETLKQKGIEVVGVSADDEESHQLFVQKYNLPFRLIADTSKKIINAYGVWGEKIVSDKKQDGILRTTFIIDENGTIENIILKVETSSHTEQILAAINSLTIKN